MKKMHLIPLLSLIFMFNVASTCSSDDDSSSSTPTDPTPIINTVSSGDWHITLYEDDGVDETYHFTGYTFTFDSSNVLTATNGTDTHTG